MMLNNMGTNLGCGLGSPVAHRLGSLSLSASGPIMYSPPGSGFSGLGQAAGEEPFMDTWSAEDEANYQEAQRPDPEWLAMQYNSDYAGGGGYGPSVVGPSQNVSYGGGVVGVSSGGGIRIPTQQSSVDWFGNLTKILGTAGQVAPDIIGAVSASQIAQQQAEANIAAQKQMTQLLQQTAAMKSQMPVMQTGVPQRQYTQAPTTSSDLSKLALPAVGLLALILLLK